VYVGCRREARAVWRGVVQYLVFSCLALPCFVPSGATGM
jgi:hypothetical protein